MSDLSLELEALDITIFIQLIEIKGLDFYKNGYIDGYLAAIEKIIGCMGESCNKLRLESIDKVINENKEKM